MAWASPLASAATRAAVARWSAAAHKSSTSSASVKATSTWIEDSSAETRVVIHLRDTMSMMATAHRLARVKWVKSYPHTNAKQIE